MPISVPYRSPAPSFRKRVLILMSSFFLGIFALFLSTQQPSAQEPETPSITAPTETDSTE